MADSQDILGHRLDRTVFAHSVLFSVAEHSLARGKESSRKPDFLSALVMAAFSFEAYLNFLGKNLIPFWSNIDRISVRDKLLVICKHIAFEPDFGRSPYQSLNELWQFRNALAHARTETLVVVRDGPPPELIAFPEVAWEKQCTRATSERLLKDTRGVIDDLHVRAKQTDGGLGQLEFTGGSFLKKRRPNE